MSASPLYLKARRVALYLAADGEIDPVLLAMDALRRNKQIYLPVLHPLTGDRMLFVAWNQATRLRRNRFGIPQPATLAGLVSPWQLDLVLTPLVAFDDQGGRLGMGGGFYDRTFATDLTARWPRCPHLAGLAHGFQRVEALPGRPWDVPLDAVFTG